MQKIESEFLEINRKDRARVPSLEIHYRAPSERVCDFEEVNLPLSPWQAKYEASRCIECPEPAACVLSTCSPATAGVHHDSEVPERPLGSGLEKLGPHVDLLEVGSPLEAHVAELVPRAESRVPSRVLPCPGFLGSLDVQRIA